MGCRPRHPRSRTDDGGRPTCPTTGTSTGSCPGWTSTPGCSRSPRTSRSRCSSAPSSSRSSRRTSTSSTWCGSPGLKRRDETGLSVRSADGLTPREQLAYISKRNQELVEQHAAAWEKRLRADARRAGHPDREVVGAHRRAARAAVELLPRADLPGAHPARGRPGAPVPLHLRAVAEPRGDRARPERRRRAVRARQGARQRVPAGADRPQPRRARRDVPAAGGADRGAPRRPVRRHAGHRGARVPRHPQRRPRGRGGPGRGPVEGAGT